MTLGILESHIGLSGYGLPLPCLMDTSEVDGFHGNLIVSWLSLCWVFFSFNSTLNYFFINLNLCRADIFKSQNHESAHHGNRPIGPCCPLQPNCLTELDSLPYAWSITFQTFPIHLPIQVFFVCPNYTCLHHFLWQHVPCPMHQLPFVRRSCELAAINLLQL